MVMTCQCRFISGDKCSALVRDVDGEGGLCMCGTECTGEIAVLAAQLCCEPKTALNSNV